MSKAACKERKVIHEYNEFQDPAPQVQVTAAEVKDSQRPGKIPGQCDAVIAGKGEKMSARTKAGAFGHALGEEALPE